MIKQESSIIHLCPFPDISICHNPFHFVELYTTAKPGGTSKYIEKEKAGIMISIVRDQSVLFLT